MLVAEIPLLPCQGLTAGLILSGPDARLMKAVVAVVVLVLVLEAEIPLLLPCQMPTVGLFLSGPDGRLNRIGILDRRRRRWWCWEGEEQVYY